MAATGIAAPVESVRWIVSGASASGLWSVVSRTVPLTCSASPTCGDAGLICTVTVAVPSAAAAAGAATRPVSRMPRTARAAAAVVRKRNNGRITTRTPGEDRPPRLADGLAEQRVHEGLGLERSEVVGPLAEPDELDRHAQLALHGDDDAALGRAVELREHDARHVDDLGEDA